MPSKTQRHGMLSAERNDEAMAFTEVGAKDSPVRPLNVYEGNEHTSSSSDAPSLRLMLRTIAKTPFSSIVSQLNVRLEESKIINVAKAEFLEKKLRRIIELYIRSTLDIEEVENALRGLEEVLEQSLLQSVFPELTPKEQALYEILTRHESISNTYRLSVSYELIKELYIGLCANCTVDWYKKESTTAAMRNFIKRLLKRHYYPQEHYASVITAVMKQCEYWER